MSIRQCRKEDLQSVAALHKAALSHEVSLLAQSPVSVIERFYAECLDDCVFLVNEEHGKINGFVLGGRAENVQAARRRFYWKNLHSCLALMAFRPGLALHMLSKWRNLFLGTRLEGRVQEVGAPWILQLFAVSEEARGTGLALRLAEAFEGALAKPCRYQISVATYNKRAIRFYLKMQCQVARETQDSLLLIKEIP
jgi:ribosomal protein S18 acetylase RimI-like enzyme